MADFSFLSDTDDSAVEDLISQTQELCVLEQVAAINCSGFTKSALPSELETRFRKLKSFPVAKSKPKKLSSPSPPPSSSDLKPHFDSKKERKKSAQRDTDSDDDECGNEIFSPAKQNPPGKTTLKPRKRPESAPPPPDPSDSKKEQKKSAESERDYDDESENEIFSPAKQNPAGKTPVKPRKRPESDAKFSPSPNGKKGSNKVPKPKSKPRLISSSSSESFNLSMDSPSPPRSAGCLWWSPKKSSGKKKSKKKPRDRKLGSADLDWGSDEDFLSDLGIFSAKERRKIMSKAMKAEEKINREAERIVKWAKQASARMRASNIRDEHELSDDDDHTTR